MGERLSFLWGLTVIGVAVLSHAATGLGKIYEITLFRHRVAGNGGLWPLREGRQIKWALLLPQFTAQGPFEARKQRKATEIESTG